MTKKFKRTFAGLTSLALLFSSAVVVPNGSFQLISGITADAAETEVPYFINVGDTDIKFYSVEDFSIPGVRYDDDAATLSLNNVSITTYYSGRTFSGICFNSQSNGYVNLKLTGNNFIGNNSNMNAGISADRTNVTFTGTGSLEINANDFALHGTSNSFTFKPDADYEMTIYAAYKNGEYTEIGTATADNPFTLNGNDEEYFDSYGYFKYPWLKAVSSYHNVLESGTTGDCTWTMLGSGALYVSGNGAMADYTDSSEVPWNAYISEIKNVTIDNGVTHIGDNSFSGCTSLESIKISSGVTFIGNGAFRSCSNLMNIDIKSASLSLGNNIFADCPNLTAIHVPCNSVTDFNNNPDAAEKVVKSHDYAGNICTVCGDLTSQVNMPVTGTNSIELTESNSSVTIYDDGGAERP